MSHPAQVSGHSNTSVTHTTQVRVYSNTSASQFKSRGHSNISFTHDTSQRSRQHLCLNKHRSEGTTTLLSHNTRSEVTAPLSHTTHVRGHSSTSVSQNKARGHSSTSVSQNNVRGPSGTSVTHNPVQMSQQHLCHTHTSQAEVTAVPLPHTGHRIGQHTRSSYTKTKTKQKLPQLLSHSNTVFCIVSHDLSHS